MKYLLLFFSMSALALDPGKVLYSSTCAICHNVNPKKEGGVGPAVFGSSKDLLRSKVRYGIYPKNYKPKRPTNIMPIFPLEESDIDALYRYLNCDGKSCKL